MLQVIRAKASSWVAKLLFLLLIVSFGVWGIGDIFGTVGRDATVATAGGTDISAEQLSREFRRELERLRPIFGGQLDTERARQLGLLDRALDRLVNEALYAKEMRTLGIVVPDEVLRRFIAEEQSFRNEAGLFDRGRFAAVLRNAGLSEAEYEALLRRDLASDQFSGSISAAVQPPAPLADALYRYRNEKRVAQYLFVDAAALAAPADPTEDEMKAHLDANKARFSTPEYRALEAVLIDPAEIAKDVKIDEARLREAYTLHLGEFKKPERRSLLQMVLPDEEAAKQAKDEIDRGADFLAVAKDKAKMDDSAVKLGTVARNALLPELADAAFALAQGAVSAPVRSPFGWHLLKAETIEPAKTDTFEEAKEKLAADLQREAAGDAAVKASHRFEDERAGGAAFEEAASRAGLKSIKIAAIDRTGHGAGGAELPGIGTVREIVAAIFDTAVGADSAPIDTPSGGIVFVRVTGITPSAPRPFDQVKDALKTAMIAERRSKAAEAAANAIKDKVAAGAALAEAASQAELKATPAVTQPFTRDNVEAFGRRAPAMLAAAFKAKPDEVLAAAAAGGWLVAKLDTVIAADPAQDKAGLDQVRDGLRQSISADVMAQVTAALRDRLGVSIQQQRIDRLFNK